MEHAAFPHRPGNEPVPGEAPVTLSERPLDDAFVVSVLDRREGGCRRATVLGSTDEAQRLVEALIAAGCDSTTVSVFQGREVGMQVSLRPIVRIDAEPEDGCAVWNVPLPMTAPSTVVESPDEPSGAPERAGPNAFGSMPTTDSGGVQVVSATSTTGGWGIHIRADRLAWVCLWTVSIVVLAASLLTALSRPAPRAFVPGAPQSEAQGISGEGIVLDSAAAPLQDEREATPECAQGEADACNCADFGTQAAAQAFYERVPAADGHIVDTDGNGLFCEWLPAGVPGPE